jgi:hypothetical protein
MNEIKHSHHQHGPYGVGLFCAFFLIHDRVKLLVYRILDLVKPAKAVTPSDLTPQIAKLAYELYEREGCRDGHALEDWDEAGREIRKKESVN